MSSPDQRSSGVHTGEDRIDFKKVVAVGVVSLVIFALASWWAISILHTERAMLTSTRGNAKVPAELGRAEIGIVDQVPFEGDKRLPRWRAERAGWLNGYGWVDRPNSVIHMPIERAMDEIVAGAVPPPSVGGGAPGPGRAPSP
jgi:hypothetical protein